jgi:DNA gyrase subunit A
LREGDEVVRVVPTSGDDDLMVVTYRGMSIRFNEDEVREVGRDSTGVRGIKLVADDKAISLDVVRDDADLFLVTDTGFGKRVKVERFNRQGRGGQGVRAIKLSAARGFVVAAFMVNLEDEVLLASSGGVLIRTPVREVSSQGRDATGVRVMNLDEGHSVATAAVVPTEED